MHRSFTRVLAVAAAASLCGTFASSAALADDLKLAGGTQVVAGQDTLDLTVGAAGKAVSFSLKATKDSPESRSTCNVDATHKARFTVNFGNSAYASASPGTLDFTACDTPQNVTFTPVAAGTTTVSLAYNSAPSNPLNSNFDVSGATFQLRVTGVSCPAAPAAPTISASPSAAASGWYNAATGAPTATITPAAASPATTQQYSLDGAPFTSGSSVPVTSDGTHTLIARSVIPAAGSCSAVTGASSAPMTLRVDRTAPTYSISVPAVTGLGGWDTSNVTVTYSCSDATSGLAAACPAGTTYTNGQSAAATSSSITDNAGNSSQLASRRAIMVDTVAPTVTSDVAGATGADGWDTSAFTVHYTCADAAPSGGIASGAASCPADETFSEANSPQAERTVSVQDAAGNTSDTYTRRAVKVDSTDPLASVSVSPTANSAGWNNATVTATYTCSDAGGSALASGSCPTNETFSTDGSYAEKTSTVKDGAGNDTTVTRRLVQVDKTAPTVTVTYEDASGDALTTVGGWYLEDVHVVFHCSDATVNGVASGLVTAPAYACPSDYWVRTEGTNAGSSYDVRDQAGNATTGSVPAIKLDKAAPVLSVVVTPSTANGGGWNNTAVTVDWTCSDSASGVTDCPADESLADGADVAARAAVTVTDAAGRTSNAVSVRAIKIDTQKPTATVTLTDSEAEGGNVLTPTGGYFAQTVWVHVACADQGSSGLVAAGSSYACPAPFAYGEGDHASYTDAVHDNAGNSTSYTVPQVDVDTTAPTATVQLLAADGTTVIAPNANGWFNQPVTVHVICTDPVSEGVASGVVATTCPADVTRGQGTHGAGTFNVSDVAGNTTGGSVPAIKVDTTLPTIGYSLRDAAGEVIAPNANNWFNQAVTVHFTCADTGGSGVDDTSAALNPCPSDLTLGQGMYDASTFYVDDKAGNQGSTTVQAINIDTEAPVIALSTVSAKAARVGTTDWWKDGYTATFSVTESGSGLAPSVPSSFTRPSSGEGSAVTVGSATAGAIVDLAGNVATDVTSTGLHVDGSAPTAGAAITSTPAYTAGDGTAWFKDEVNLAWTATDPLLSDGTAGSGLTASTSGTAKRTASGSFNYTATDNVGHSTTSDAVTFLVDSSAPTVALDCTRLPSVIRKGDVVTLPWAASDVGSGVAGAASGSVTLDTSSVAITRSAVVPAGAVSDNVGHTSAASNSCSFGVSYDWRGFYQPVDVAGGDASVSAVRTSTIFNRVKAGSAIPVKFDLRGDMGLGVLASGYPKTLQVACPSSLVADAIEEVATDTTSGLKYDATTNAPYGQYNYTWKTASSYAGTCQRLEVRLIDGTSHFAFFQFTK
jgi:hypothetical protein